MPLVFGHHRLDRRNLDHLMTKRPGIFAPYGRLAATTAFGFQNDDLIHFFNGDKRTRMARMTWLTPTTAPTARTTRS